MLPSEAVRYAILPLKLRIVMLQHNNIKPHDTLLLTIEVVVSYECESRPKVVTFSTNGMRNFTFILGTRYEVFVGMSDYDQVPCEDSDSDTSVRFEYVLDIQVRDVLQVGFSLGNYSALLTSYAFSPTVEPWKGITPCIECEDKEVRERMAAEMNNDPQDERASRRREFGPLLSLLGFSGLAAATTLSLIYYDHPSGLGKIFLSGASLSLVASLAITAQRMIARKRRSGLSEHERGVTKPIEETP